MEITELIRYVGNFTILAGQYIVLNKSKKWGCFIRLFGTSCLIPFSIQTQLWDLIFLLSVFSYMDVQTIIKNWDNEQ